MPAPWFGVTYPSLDDLQNLSLTFGVPVEFASWKQPFLQWDTQGPLVIVVPEYYGDLARIWGVAHEVGHLVLGHGPLGWKHRDTPEELAANRWAAQALIPEARIRAYKYPSAKGFVKALNKRYQEVTPSIQSLAWFIAYSRLRALEEVG